MIELILIIHIASGVLSITGTIGNKLAQQDTTKVLTSKFATTSTLLVMLSGCGLLLNGASLTRTCAGGAILIATIVLIQRAPLPRSSTV